MAIISNTSPVIALAQTGKLEILRELYSSVSIPPSVKAECIDKGRAMGAPDVHEIERGVSEGWIKVVPLEKKWETEAARLIDHAQIGQGEAEAIVLAKETRTPVILDDAEARAVARSLRLQYHGTIMVPYEAFVKGLISRAEFVKLVSDLSKILWVSPGVVAEILRKGEEVKK